MVFRGSRAWRSGRRGRPGICPAVANPDQADGNLDGAGNACQPTIDVVSVVPGGSALLGTIELDNPDGDPLHGEVQVLAGPGDPVAITMEMLASCSTTPVDLVLNGVTIDSLRVGDSLGGLHCACRPPGVERTVATDAALMATLFDEFGPNVIRATTKNKLAIVGWLAVSIQYGDGSTQRTCVLGNCTQTSLCNPGFPHRPFDISAPVPGTTAVVQSVDYDESTLPAFLDTSTLASGSYILRASTSDGFTPADKDQEYFTLDGQPRLAINDTPPEALCGDVAVAAPASQCAAEASIDLGSFDPEGHAITLSQSPAGPYGPGAHAVTLTASDGVTTDTCEATVTVVDGTPPAFAGCSDITVEATPERAGHLHQRGQQRPPGHLQLLGAGPGAEHVRCIRAAISRLLAHPVQ